MEKLTEVYKVLYRIDDSKLVSSIGYSITFPKEYVVEYKLAHTPTLPVGDSVLYCFGNQEDAEKFAIREASDGSRKFELWRAWALNARIDGSLFPTVFDKIESMWKNKNYTYSKLRTEPSMMVCDGLFISECLKKYNYNY